MDDIEKRACENIKNVYRMDYDLEDIYDTHKDTFTFSARCASIAIDDLKEALLERRLFITIWLLGMYALLLCPHIAEILR